MTTNSAYVKSTLVNIRTIKPLTFSASKLRDRNEIHILSLCEIVKDVKGDHFQGYKPSLCEIVKDVKGDHFQGYKPFSKLNHSGQSVGCKSATLAETKT